ncbi:hypothetical protein ACA910_022432 [Epithemia clementina (nom. ined.)]
MDKESGLLALIAEENSSSPAGTANSTSYDEENHGPDEEDNNNSSISSDTPATSPEADDKESMVAPAPPTMLSAASKMFDRDNKGYLDPTERALRQLDTDNDGKLTSHNIYDIMRSLQDSQKLSGELIESLQREQKKALNLKKAVIFLIGFAVLLSVANIATSFVAARLAQDTQISTTNGDLESRGTNIRVGTTNKMVGVQIRPATSEAHRRFLQTSGFDWCTSMSRTGGRYCSVQGVLDYGVARDIYRYLCPSLIQIPGGACPTTNGGVSQLYISCNAKASVIQGGIYLPMQGPAILNNQTWFPAAPHPTLRFVYSGIVHLYDQTTTTCAQHFDSAIICDQFNQDDECFFLATPTGSICSAIAGTPESNPNFQDDALLLCGDI